MDIYILKKIYNNIMTWEMKYNDRKKKMESRGKTCNNKRDRRNGIGY